MLTNFPSISTSVRSPAEHALVADDAHSEVIDSDTMRLAAHDLRSHVARRARRIFLVLWVPNSCNTKISDLKIAILVEDEVFRLDVTMQNALLVEVLERKQHASYEESRLLLIEFLVLGQVVSEITALHEINDKEQIFTVVERVVHVDEEPIFNLNASASVNYMQELLYLRVVQLRQEFLLVHDGVDRALRNDTCLQHLLHGEQLLGTAASLLYLPDLTEATATNDILEVKVVPGDLYMIEQMIRSAGFHRMKMMMGG